MVCPNVLPTTLVTSQEEQQQNQQQQQRQQQQNDHWDAAIRNNLLHFMPSDEHLFLASWHHSVKTG
jgi:hypothetical protein